MEDLLLNIVKEANSTKLTNLKQRAQEAHGKLFVYVLRTNRTLTFLFVILDLLAAQNNLLRNPSHELRSVCFLPLKIALESKKSKLVSLALTGLNVSNLVISHCFR